MTRVRKTLGHSDDIRIPFPFGANSVSNLQGYLDIYAYQSQNTLTALAIGFPSSTYVTRVTPDALITCAIISTRALCRH